MGIPGPCADGSIDAYNPCVSKVETAGSDGKSNVA
jgi:hypothetical protein